jgi:hypothetical protein
VTPLLNVALFVAGVCFMPLAIGWAITRWREIQRDWPSIELIGLAAALLVDLIFLIVQIDALFTASR